MVLVAVESAFLARTVFVVFLSTRFLVAGLVVFTLLAGFLTSVAVEALVVVSSACSFSLA